MNYNPYQFLNKIIRVVIDRPAGSKHEKFCTYYPINYGYIPNTLGLDGDEIDVYVLGVDIPKKMYTGKCIAIIHRINDNDDKLIVVPDGKIFTNNEIKSLVEFQEKYFKSIIIRGYLSSPSKLLLSIYSG